MKLKRMIIFMLLTVMLILPVASAEARARICPYCGTPSMTQGFVCGGIYEPQEEGDPEMTEVINCEEHGKYSNGLYKCQITREYGYTVYKCGAGRHHDGFHACHDKHSVETYTRSICPYGDYPR